MIVEPSKNGKYDVSVQAGAGIVADFPKMNIKRQLIKQRYLKH